MELCYYIQSCPPFFCRSHIHPCLSCCRDKQDLLCVLLVLFNMGDTHTHRRSFIPHLYSRSHFQSHPLSSISILFPSFTRVTFPTFFALIEKPTSYLVMREPGLLQGPRGLIKLALSSNRKHDTAFSCWQLLCLCVSTCVKVFLLRHRLFACVCVSE